MELSEYVAKLRGELTSITRFAGEDVAKAAELLAETLESSVRLTLLDVLSAAAADITARLGDTAVEVRLADGEPTFVVLTAPEEDDEPLLAGVTRMAEELAEAGRKLAGDPGTARLTLRLPDSLKARIETAAANDGTSVNTWLVRVAGRALDNPGRSGQADRRGPGQRITGYARS
jgi:hypothetical protein